jgi:hypothetical protein
MEVRLRGVVHTARERESPLSSVSYMELLQQQDTDRRESVGRVMPSPRR